MSLMTVDGISESPHKNLLAYTQLLESTSHFLSEDQPNFTLRSEDKLTNPWRQCCQQMIVPSPQFFGR